MKRYIKDGEIKTRNQIVIKGQRTIKDKDGNDKVVGTNTYNPTEEMILADGWEEYVTPEPTEEELLSRAKRNKVREVGAYDTSEEVNIFYMQGQPMWLDFEDRSRLLLRFQAETAKGNETTTLWSNGKEYALPLSVAINMLYELETYASKCYDNTQRHLANIDVLKNIEDIESYDYRIGYPEKLEF